MAGNRYKGYHMTKLDELVKQINREHVYIQTHNFPDPDAIASAFGLQELLKNRGIHSTICYKGKIDRYSTDKLREILDIKLENLEDLDSKLTEDLNMGHISTKLTMSSLIHKPILSLSLL